MNYAPLTENFSYFKVMKINMLTEDFLLPFFFLNQEIPILLPFKGYFGLCAAMGLRTELSRGLDNVL